MKSVKCHSLIHQKSVSECCCIKGIKQYSYCKKFFCGITQLVDYCFLQTDSSSPPLFFFTYQLTNSFYSFLQIFLKNLLLLRSTHRWSLFHSDLSANCLQVCNEPAPLSPSALFNTSQETLSFWRISLVTTISV